MTALRLASPAIGALARAVSRILGDDLAGLYLYGSATAGGFDARVSDIDLLAVTNRPLGELDLRAIERSHAEFIELHPEWRDRIDVAYVSGSTMATFRDGGPLAVVSPGEPFHVTAGVERWIANWYLVRETGVALVGPPPSALVAPVTRAEFLAEVTIYAREVRERSIAAASPRDRAYAVLTMSRAYRTIVTGTPCSKLEASEWARERFPEWRRLLDEAVDCWRSGGSVGLATERSWREAERFVMRLGEALAGSAIAKDGRHGVVDPKEKGDGLHAEDRRADGLDP